MADIFGFTDTWDAVGTTYTGIGLTVTDTASASGSKLIEATASSGGSFIVDKNATVALTAGIGTIVAGGGANGVPVVCDGTDWRIG